MDHSPTSRASEVLENIYHKGQDKIWDGRAVLDTLITQHGGVAKLDDKTSHSLRRVLSMILRGEKAAWKISLQLAYEISNIEAKLAATSQAHDESRHFYVLRDYLLHRGPIHDDLPRSVIAALEMVENTGSLGKKLLGMQLMVEPIALTIFQEIRRLDIDPVLSDLFPYFERDEARHVALGVQYLPTVIKSMNPIQISSLIAWQFRLFMLELSGLKEMRNDLEAVGLDPEKVFSLAEAKQLNALEQFTDELGITSFVWSPLRQLIRIRKDMILGSK
jgi:hypothetical protein